MLSRSAMVDTSRKKGWTCKRTTVNPLHTGRTPSKDKLENTNGQTQRQPTQSVLTNGRQRHLSSRASWRKGGFWTTSAVRDLDCERTDLSPGTCWTVLSGDSEDHSSTKQTNTCQAPHLCTHLIKLTEYHKSKKWQDGNLKRKRQESKGATLSSVSTTIDPATGNFQS